MENRKGDQDGTVWVYQGELFPFYHFVMKERKKYRLFMIECLNSATNDEGNNGSL